jgi:nucleotide-binding universal stress UspA family protein
MDPMPTTNFAGAPIVVGVDDSDTAQVALRTALDLAARMGGALVVVSAFLPLREGELRALRRTDHAPRDVAWREQPSSDVQALLAEARALAETAGVVVECVARQGPPATAIVAVAAERGAGLIVVGNRGMRGRQRLRGSVPNDVSHTAPCSVLIVDTVGALAA